MTMDRNSRPEKPGRDSNSVIVLSVECLEGSSTADEWTGDMLQTGDIVEEILIGSGSSLSGSRSIRYKAPFKNGKSGVQKILHKSFKNKETSIVVRVRRGRDEFTELHACVVPESGFKNKYVLRSIEDPNYAVGFTDRSEAECFELQDFRYYKKHGSPTRISPLQECMFKSQNQSPQESYSVENFTGVFKYQWNRKPHEIFFNDGFSAEILSVFFKANRIFTVVDDVFQFSASRSSRIVSALQRAKLQDGYVAYPWENKMQEYLLLPTSSSFLSLLLLPKASDRVASRYNDLEDTLARAHAWLYASQASGVPIVFMNIQTESLLTKISGETASSTVNAGSFSDLSRLAHVSLYGFEDYHGVDLGVVRAVRLWYAPLCGEFAIEVKIKEDDTKLGFAISRTEEGFIYVSSVMADDDNAPSTRSGLCNLYKEATSSSRLLVVSRLSNQKVLPWMVSSTGAVRCFDTVSLSQKLSLHRHAKVPILIHVLLWDGTLPSPPSAGSTGRFRSVSPPVMALPPEIQLARQPSQNQIQPLPAADIPNDAVVGSEADIRLDRDTAGETSFRFDYFSLPNNWV